MTFLAVGRPGQGGVGAPEHLPEEPRLAAFAGLARFSSERRPLPLEPRGAREERDDQRAAVIRLR